MEVGYLASIGNNQSASLPLNTVDKLYQRDCAFTNACHWVISAVRQLVGRVVHYLASTAPKVARLLCFGGGLSSFHRQYTTCEWTKEVNTQYTTLNLHYINSEYKAFHFLWILLYNTAGIDRLYQLERLRIH